MTTPAPAEFAPYVERWGHPRAEYVLDAAQAPVAAGTVQRWPVTLTGTPWPPVSPGTRQPEIYRVRDLDNPGEVIRVLHTSPAAGSWDVMRGDQGTAPVAHAAGAELAATVSAEGLRDRAQGVLSGNGLVLPTGVTAPASWSDSSEHRLTGMTVPGGEITDAGCLYQATAFGYVTIAAGQAKDITYAIRWGLVEAAISAHPWTLTRAAGVAGDQCRWRLDCWAAFHQVADAALPIITSIMRLTHKPANPPTPFPIVIPPDPLQSTGYLGGALTIHTGFTPRQINPALTVDFHLSAQLATGAPAVTMVLLGGRAWRAG